MDKHVPNADIRRAWLDQSLTSAQAAASVGLARATLWSRAKGLGLPPRKDGRREVIPGEDLRLLWSAGVLVRDIADHYGCARQTISQSARRLGLPVRVKGRKPLITLASYRQELLGRAMQRRLKLEAVHRNARLQVDAASEQHRL
ncbi:hypothetical protein [Pseudorhodobacter sp.]|uniref:hypothetical protein n=1 Tax=Pseudorhodobacter sp. TaxID=1934400 RepID=UPI002648195B|nr:hypothetical protein [Pseudorhodobacter sp.]MDN5785729.1 hypothetical protein [Pseudorhodobacter sp.]